MQKAPLDASIALYERLLAEKNERISELTVALEHERARPRSGIWPDLRAGFIGFLLGIPLGFVKSLVTQAFVTHTASVLVFSFLAIYFSLVATFAFFLVRRVYRNRKAAQRVGPEASYAVQLFYSVVLSFAITMEIITGPHPSGANLPGLLWLLFGSIGAVAYNFLRLKAYTNGAGKPLPSLLQVSAWLALKA